MWGGPSLKKRFGMVGVTEEQKVMLTSASRLRTGMCVWRGGAPAFRCVIRPVLSPLSLVSSV